MHTSKQELGELGEHLVVKNCSCPRCKRPGTLRRLGQNFKCALVAKPFLHPPPERQGQLLHENPA